MNTRKMNQKLFKDALVEAMLREFDRDMEHCEESPICSPEHYKRMSEIVGFDVTKPRRNKHKMSLRKRIIIFIIAAALALTGCVAAIYYRQIGNFMEKFYKDHIEVWFDNEEANQPPKQIEDVYTLTYVPDGYELIHKEQNELWVSYHFKNNSDKLIIFEQWLFNDLNQVIDSEEGDSTTIRHKNFTIYCKNMNDSFYYRFYNEKYAFSISTRCILPEPEILKILDGLKTE